MRIFSFLRDTPHDDLRHNSAYDCSLSEDTLLAKLVVLGIYATQHQHQHHRHQRKALLWHPVVTISINNSDCLSQVDQLHSEQAARRPSHSELIHTAPFQRSPWYSKTRPLFQSKKRTRGRHESHGLFDTDDALSRRALACSATCKLPSSRQRQATAKDGIHGSKLSGPSSELRTGHDPPLLPFPYPSLHRRLGNCASGQLPSPSPAAVE